MGSKFLKEIKEAKIKLGDFNGEMILENLESFYKRFPPGVYDNVIEKINHLKSIEFHKQIAQPALCL